MSTISTGLSASAQFTSDRPVSPRDAAMRVFDADESRLSMRGGDNPLGRPAPPPPVLRGEDNPLGLPPAPPATPRDRDDALLPGRVGVRVPFGEDTPLGWQFHDRSPASSD